MPPKKRMSKHAKKQTILSVLMQMINVLNIVCIQCLFHSHCTPINVHIMSELFEREKTRKECFYKSCMFLKFLSARKNCTIGR